MAITNQMRDDILTAAFEGGISYWCHNIAVAGGEWPAGATYAAEVPSKGGALVLEVYGEPSVTLDRRAIDRGIRAAAKDYKLSVDAFYEGHDAGMADSAVQFGVFGKQVFA